MSITFVSQVAIATRYGSIELNLFSLVQVFLLSGGAVGGYGGCENGGILYFNVVILGIVSEGAGIS